jgi:hypothetical protein
MQYETADAVFGLWMEARGFDSKREFAMLHPTYFYIGVAQ